MKRVLITGMSGAGKSAVVGALRARGYRAFDADVDGLSEVAAVDGDATTGIGGGRDWVWRLDRIREVLAAHPADLVFLAGCSPNQGQLYPLFDHVVLLSLPPDVLAHRLATRVTNPFGKDPGELARTLELCETVEPLLRAGATLEIDSRTPLDEVVARILDHVGPAAPPRSRSPTG
ncbi:MAG TPA: AAA family ATPase [Asanoa sp.]